MAPIFSGQLSFSADYCVGYGSKVVARTETSVSASVERPNSSSITLVCGSNGAGKTTLLRSLSGIIPVLKGSASFNGKALEKNSSTRICYLPESLDFLEYLTPYQILKQLGNISRQRFDELAQRIHLSPKDAEFQSLSKGNRQKVRFLLSYHMIEQNDLLLLDEPFSGLDIDTREYALAMLGEALHSKSGKQLLLCLHTERMPVDWCDSSIGIYEGKIMTGPGFGSVYDAQSYFRKLLASRPKT